MRVVITPALAEIDEELMIEVEVERPLIVDVSVLTAEAKSLLLRKEAVVVAVLPLTMEVSVKELEEVAMVRV